MDRLRTSGLGPSLAVTLSAMVPALHLAAAVHFVSEPHRYCEVHARLEAGKAASVVAPSSRTDDALMSHPDKRRVPHGSDDPHTACTLVAVCDTPAVTSGGGATVVVTTGPQIGLAPRQTYAPAARIDLLAAPKQSPPAGVAS